MEERLKGNPNSLNRALSQGRSMSNGTPPSNGTLSRKVNSSASSRIINATSLLKQARNLSGSFESDSTITNGDTNEKESQPTQVNGTLNNGISVPSENGTEKSRTEHEDCVSGTLYDMLQKEVITLRKVCHEKDQSLNDKDDAIEVC